MRLGGSGCRIRHSPWQAYLRFDKSAIALDCLEEAYRNHTLPVDRLDSDAQFDSLRSEPRFQALLHGLNFPVLN
jgi:hypothetical protein